MARYANYEVPADRPDIDTTLMGTAHLWAERSTCSRNHVGAVIARRGRSIGTGYNGAPAGMAHCDHPTIDIMVGDRLSPIARLPEGGPYDRGCKIATHAEANAIAYAARHGVSTEKGTIYTTLSPCYECAKLIIAAGLIRVVFDMSYRDPAGIDLLRNAGLEVDNMSR